MWEEGGGRRRGRKVEGRGWEEGSGWPEAEEPEVQEGTDVLTLLLSTGS